MIIPNPESLPVEEFTRLPDKFRRQKKSSWADANLRGLEVESFLEGPSFDKDGKLFVVDIPFGRIFRISSTGDWELITQYDGWPNGLKIHKDGRIFITDYKRGLMLLDAGTGKVTSVLETYCSEGFKGLNDLFFATNGDLYFTDQGQTGLHDSTGRVFCLRPSGKLDLLIDTIPSPNGLVMDLKETKLYIAVTRANAIWRLPIMLDGGVTKAGLFIQMSGGPAGPDGIALDIEGGLVVAHPGTTVWRYDHRGFLTHYLEAKRDFFFTNLSYGWPDNRTLFVVESISGAIYRSTMPIPGKPMYSHCGENSL
jgi:gluconolactonase